MEAGAAPEGQVCADDASKTKTIEVHIIGMSFQISIFSLNRYRDRSNEGNAEGREPGSVSVVHATTSTTAAFMAMNDVVTRVSELPLDKVRTAALVWCHDVIEGRMEHWPP